MRLPSSCRVIGECLNKNGSSGTRSGQSLRYRESGEVSLAVANSITQRRMRIKSSRISSSTNKPKSFRNTIGASTVASMSTIFMLERATFNMSRAKMRKSANNSKISREKRRQKRQSSKNRLLGQNSMSLHPTFIIWRLLRLSRVCTTLHIRN